VIRRAICGCSDMGFAGGMVSWDSTAVWAKGLARRLGFWQRLVKGRQCSDELDKLIVHILCDFIMEMQYMPPLLVLLAVH